MKQVHCKDTFMLKFDCDTSCFSIQIIVTDSKFWGLQKLLSLFICISNFTFCLKVAQQDSKEEATLFTSSQVR